MVRLLLTFGAVPHIWEDFGKTPLDLARAARAAELVELLAGQG